MKDSLAAPAESSGPPADERALVGRCQGGDTEAYRILVDRYRDRAYGLALRLLRSPSDAEEVAQDAFVRAWRALPDFRGDAAFGSWLYRIVWRRAVDRAAVLRHRRSREADLAAAEHVASPETADRALAADEDRWLRLVDGLSEPQRAVVTLFYYHDQSVKEVATALTMPEGTVKTHLARARAALRARRAAVAGGGAGEVSEEGTNDAM
ncbi:MAG TPA: RNA polymerase sigma factor [Candidatus Eisenbacteria bacterium]